MSRRGGTRISGGELKGRRVAVPPGVRPTGGLIKEALFSMWAERIPGSRFLDLFAGSGAVGLDALSRGAASVTWVEGESRVARATRHSVEKVAGAGSRVILAFLPDQIGRVTGGPFDLIFADPPYEYGGYEALIGTALDVMAASGSLAIEHSDRVSLPKSAGSLELLDSRRYGDSRLSLYGNSPEQ